MLKREVSEGMSKLLVEPGFEHWSSMPDRRVNHYDMELAVPYQTSPEVIYSTHYAIVLEWVEWSERKQDERNRKVSYVYALRPISKLSSFIHCS